MGCTGVVHRGFRFWNRHGFPGIWSRIALVVCSTYHLFCSCIPYFTYHHRKRTPEKRAFEIKGSKGFLSGQVVYHFSYSGCVSLHQYGAFWSVCGATGAGTGNESVCFGHDCRHGNRHRSDRFVSFRLVVKEIKVGNHSPYGSDCYRYPLVFGLHRYHCCATNPGAGASWSNRRTLHCGRSYTGRKPGT